MKRTITSTDAVRHFGDWLARVKHRGDRFAITRNGKVVAELGPPTANRRARLGELAALLEEFPADREFADDLESVAEADTPPDDPWA